MDAQKKPNSILRCERQVRGWSQRKLADLLGTSEDVVSRWERGERKPSPFFQEKFCLLYGKSADELGFLPPTLIVQMTDIVQSIHERLDQAESIINLAWEAWFASRPQQATREVTKLLPSLERMMYLSLAAVQVLRLKELVIRCHGLLGAICLDALHNDAALYHYMHAYRCAEDIRDVDLMTTYLCLVGEVLRRQKDQSGALSHMESAREQAAGAMPTTRGHILQLLAYTYGDTEQETAFERTIAEATDLLSFSGEGRDSAQKEFIPFEIYEIRGKVTRDLGRPLHAIPYLDLAEKSLIRVDSVTPRWLALLEISRAQAFCDSGDLATGIELACKGFLMAYQCHSQYQMNRVRKLLRKLEKGPFRSHPKVQDLKNLLFETYMRSEAF